MVERLKRIYKKASNMILAFVFVDLAPFIVVLAPFLFLAIREWSIYSKWDNWIVSLLHIGPGAWMTLYLAYVTGVVIWWQGQQLKKQIELQTIEKLYEEWNSPEMCGDRKLCVKAMKGNIAKGNNRDKVETVLEFLERVCSYYRKGILNDELIWDDFGIYIARYYYYNQKGNIKYIRDYWGHDKTLYEDMEKSYKPIIEYECSRRNELQKTRLDQSKLEKEYDATKE